MVWLGFLCLFLSDFQESRIGLHTHVGYSKNMSQRLETWVKINQSKDINWQNQNHQRLFKHIRSFNPLVVSWGVMEWEMSPVHINQYRIDIEANRLILGEPTDLKPGDWIFGDRCLLRVDYRESSLKYKIQMASDLSSVGRGPLTYFKSRLNRETASLLKRMPSQNLIIQLVLWPDLSLVKGYIQRALPQNHLISEKDRGFHEQDSYFYRTPVFKIPDFRVQNDSSKAKMISGQFQLESFLGNQFEDYILDLSRHAETKGGGNKIGYWLLGNEPDSFIKSQPENYASQLLQLKRILQKHHLPGKLMLANINGGNPVFGDWLEELQSEFAKLQASGSCTTDCLPFEAIGITFYINGKNWEPLPIELATAKLRHHVGQFKQLFSSDQDVELIAKEVAFQDLQDDDPLLKELNHSSNPLMTTTEELILSYIHLLKGLDFKHIIWFNQMPTGQNHGNLIDSVTTVQETALGRFLRSLNPTPKPPSEHIVTKTFKSDGWVDLPDPEFEAWALERFDSDEDEKLSLSEAAQILNVRIWESAIKDLTGLESFTNLDNLSIYQSDVQYIPSLAHLSRLREIRIQECPLENLPELPTQLEYLTLNHLTHCPEPDNQPNVQIEHLALVDIPWRSYPSFLHANAVFLSKMPIPNLDHLPSGVKKLYLDELEELQTLDFIPHDLNSLLCSSLTNDIQFNTLPPNLESLSIRSMVVNPLLTLPSTLKTVHIEDCTVLDLAGLKYLESLITLKIQRSARMELPDFENLIQLNELNLGLTPISGFGSLPPNIEKLNLSYCELEAVPDLSSMVNLKSLELSGNQIRQLPALSTLTSLQFLGARGNQLSEIPNLSENRRLTELALWGNQISELPGLEKLIDLRICNLSQNQFQRVPDFSLNGRLYFLSLSDNPLQDDCLELLKIKDRGGFYIPWSRPLRTLDLHGTGCDDIQELIQRSFAPHHVQVTPTPNGYILTWQDGNRDFLSHLGIFNESKEPILPEPLSHNRAFLDDDQVNGSSFVYVQANRPYRYEENAPTIRVELPPKTQNPYIYVVPHFVNNAQWWTTLNIFNGSEAAINIDFEVFNKLGLKDEHHYLLPPGSTSNLTDILGSDLETIGWLTFTSNHIVKATLAYGLQSQTTATAMPLEPFLSKANSLAIEPSNGTLWKGLAWANPSREEPATIELALFDEKGDPIVNNSQANLELQPLQRWVGLITDLFPELPTNARMLQWQSDAGVSHLFLDGNQEPWTQLEGGTGTLPWGYDGGTFEIADNTELQFINGIRPQCKVVVVPFQNGTEMEYSTFFLRTNQARTLKWDDISFLDGASHAEIRANGPIQLRLMQKQEIPNSDAKLVNTFECPTLSGTLFHSVFPHLPNSNGKSRLDVVNMSEEENIITVQALDSNGTLLELDTINLMDFERQSLAISGAVALKVTADYPVTVYLSQGDDPTTDGGLMERATGFSDIPMSFNGVSKAD